MFGDSFTWCFSLGWILIVPGLEMSVISMFMKGQTTCHVNKFMVKTLPQQIPEPGMETVSISSINTYVVIKWYIASISKYV